MTCEFEAGGRCGWNVIIMSIWRGEREMVSQRIPGLIRGCRVSSAGQGHAKNTMQLANIEN